MRCFDKSGHYLARVEKTGANDKANSLEKWIRLIEKTHPDEIYNLGAQSHVKVSFEVPEYV